MQLICPECKNEIDLSSYAGLDVGGIVECNHCGITLEVVSLEAGILEAEIVDEGK